MQHHACTDFEVNETFNRDKLERLGGTEQGNLVPGATCQDTSYLMFKHLEQLNLGIKITIVRIGKSLQRIAIAFLMMPTFTRMDHFLKEKCK